MLLPFIKVEAIFWILLKSYCDVEYTITRVIWMGFIYLFIYFFGGGVSPFWCFGNWCFGVFVLLLKRTSTLHWENAEKHDQNSGIQNTHVHDLVIFVVCSNMTGSVQAVAHFKGMCTLREDRPKIRHRLFLAKAHHFHLSVPGRCLESGHSPAVS